MILKSLAESPFQIDLKSKTDTSPVHAHVYVLGNSNLVQRQKEIKKIIDQESTSHQQNFLTNEKRFIDFSGRHHHVYILQNAALPASKHKLSQSPQHHGLFEESIYAAYRDLAGTLFSQLKAQKFSKVTIEFSQANKEIVRAFAVGFELAAYQFMLVYSQKNLSDIKLRIIYSGKSTGLEAAFKDGQAEARSVQIARHLVNLPPNHINPETVENLVLKELKWPKTCKIEVWNAKKLAEENMNLLLAVGAGSKTPARMIRISYRPTKKSKHRPIAFVGKGITFDTGGLDIKPSAGMRLMKKDMGGSAAVLGLAQWVVQANYSRPCDFYLALAENSIDANSMRPSDLYKSRAGYVVEIDNTDAEGRLVLADVMDVAVTQKGDSDPEILVDVATLTGAIKVALGGDLAGLFSNDDKLADEIVKAGHQAGDMCWRMPLVPKYFGSLSSAFADFKNSADGFGGAITAALFLERFCRGKKWAHLDVYCWNDKPQGAFQATGGNGQPVQCLIQWLKSKG